MITLQEKEKPTSNVSRCKPELSFWNVSFASFFMKFTDNVKTAGIFKLWQKQKNDNNGDMRFSSDSSNTQK